MDQRTAPYSPGSDFESLLDERQGATQSLFVVPMDPAKHVAPLHAVAQFLLDVDSHGRIDRILHPGSPGAKGVTSQAKELSIAPGHESVTGCAEIFHMSGTREQIRIVHHGLVAALQADDFSKTLSGRAFGTSLMGELRRLFERSGPASEPNHMCGQRERQRFQ